MNGVAAYIALGSNLDNPLQQIETAIAQIAAHPAMQLIKRAKCYRSKPVGPADQPDFINTAVMIETTLSPRDLLQALQAIEQAQHRVKTAHWGPRTIDLDIILYGDTVLTTETLIIPHAQAHLRAFVLQPLLDLDETLTLPRYGRVAALLFALNAQQNTQQDQAQLHEINPHHSKCR
ncbi:2-amino-4-hydroxy-6-hydroxymethyldihydropteridine diphosphokinase [Ostreibacterium oceani]|uniref:2-amino-4-hydroxy-6-hydroxymethyldihydropteridine pyrophosphokinase n=1 Tax=Ostreibacterium oceani TaxID=2654998 RepID=A0A6N7EST9_9GAMM|nr:2-amino-4-hydroxy-6-hydroxymethyldihydropteridine diphosphokinase [Ostreibacterium oceani]MPV85904.1 2-amino-4-hydroxy-6-hydroxymethyldihydropteridine diphosphokinase [Ostreibacterium oceani]